GLPAPPSSSSPRPGDINRFSGPEKLVSWIGLAPRVRQSGGRLRSGGDREGSPRLGVGPGSGGVGRRPVRRTPLPGSTAG
nr:transposase [Candidatus Freyarchaeota archaeon]